MDTKQQLHYQLLVYGKCKREIVNQPPTSGYQHTKVGWLDDKTKIGNIRSESKVTDSSAAIHSILDGRAIVSKLLV